jgi:signal transduction histidine kinase
LLCDIIDNGIGRQKSKEIKAKTPFIYKSFGMEVNRERLELLKSKVDVIDLWDDNGNAAGTHIKLMLNLKADLLDEK